MKQKFKLRPFEINDWTCDFKIYTTIEFLTEKKCFLEFMMEGKIEDLEIPEKKIENLREDFLWKNTCWELFLSNSNSNDEHYIEMNFSPSNAWNVYEFSRNRTGMIQIDNVNVITQIKNENREKLFATISIETNSELPRNYLNIAIILKNKVGNFSYWSLNHKADKPDFHDKINFIKML